MASNPLICCADEDSYEMVDDVLNACPKLISYPLSHWIPLDCMALLKHKHELFKHLVAQHNLAPFAPISYIGTGISLFHLTVAVDALALIDWLLYRIPTRAAHISAQDKVAFLHAHVATATHANALMMAAQWGHANTLKYFISLGMDVNKKDAVGLNALHLAFGDAKQLVTLIGAATVEPVEARRQVNQTVECAQMLLDAKCDVNTRASGSYPGMTALHFAAQLGHEQEVAFLLRAKASPSILDDEARKPAALRTKWC